MQRDYAPIMNLALELENTDPADHALRDETEGRYRAAIDGFVDQLVAERRSADAATRAVNDDLDEISALSAAELHSTYDKIRYDLLNRIEDVAGPSPWQRAAQKRLVGLGGVVLVVLLAAGYFGLRQYNLTPVTAPLETRAGLEQRANALAKVLHYESWASGRRGMIKNILLWPFEPLAEEVAGARELSSVALTGAAKLMERGEACGLQLGSGDQALTPQEYGVLNKVSDHLRNKASQWRDPPVLTVLDPIRSGYPCPASAGQAGR